MPYLFQCAIGPVQDFIATARRSRDLWYGSWMLSELSKVAAKALADEPNGKLIFPAPMDKADLEAGSLMNAPNKVVAIVAGAPDAVGERVETAIRSRLGALRDEAFSHIRIADQFDEVLAQTQVDDLLEFYWVGVEFDDRDWGYVQARATAERLLSARKATRDFQQFFGDHRPKSSLDGARESVISELAYPLPDASDAEKERKAGAIYTNFRARPAERLSGVDIMKRNGERHRSESGFPSTSEMAARPFLAHVDASDKAGDRYQLLAAIQSMLQQEHVTSDETDGALVYASRLTEWIPNREKLKSVVQALDKIIEGYSEVSPEPYYALLVADGDNMGKAIDHQETVVEHQTLSKALSGFAAEVRTIIDEHDGALVYSGGDDVMAYLPLHKALACVKKLADVFAESMDDFPTEDGASPTLSSGIVVAHHLSPLSDTLALARDAEKAAKTVPGKDALAIIVSKRSGADRTIQDKRELLSKRLNTMVQWRLSGDLSAGAPYELQALHGQLGGSGVPASALAGEALRIIERKRETGGHEMDDEKKLAVEADFRQWLVDDKISLLALAHEMIVAAQFASAMEMAGVSVEIPVEDEGDRA